MGFKDIAKLLTPPAPIQAQPGALGSPEQMAIQQRLGEGATPEQIKYEMLGPPPPPPGADEMAEAMGGR
jgi:hypothetical protein